MNTFGDLFKIHTFGESHGQSMGVIVDGCPAGVLFDMDLIIENLKNRRPGNSEIVSSRNELDEVEILSGIYQGKTLGTPIALVIKNRDANSKAYIDENNKLKISERLGHADDLWKSKYDHSDLRGGGRASGRETVARVLGGSVAEMFVKGVFPNTKVLSYVSSIFSITLDSLEVKSLNNFDKIKKIRDQNSTKIPSFSCEELAKKLLLEAKKEGKSYGGTAEVKIFNPPVNLGQPVFAKLKSELAAAFMSVGAVTGVELGVGFSGTTKEGTEFHKHENLEFYGGIRGGISTGETISYRVAFKPTSSVLSVAQQGRHDPCIVPRAIFVLESMAYLVLADSILKRRLDKVDCFPV